MSTPYPVQEGTIPFRGYETWYRIVGAAEEAGKLPLLCLHGGPGVPHEYLESLEALAATGRRVIFYDQLGCGNSTHVDDPALWTVELFVEEVDVVRRALGLERLHILGQSWGAFLALEYALAHQDRLQSLTIASGTLGIGHVVALDGQTQPFRQSQLFGPGPARFAGPRRVAGRIERPCGRVAWGICRIL